MKRCECGCGQPAPISTYTNRSLGRRRGQAIRFINGHNGRIDKRGERNPMWKGDEAGINALHVWLNGNYPRAEKCEDCGAEGPTEYANLTGEYTRRREDYRELCRACHVNLDVALGVRAKDESGRWAPSARV